MNEQLQRALETIRRGGLLIYPTETLYALGADGLSPRAVEAVAAVKTREQGKPMPLVVGSMEQLDLISPGPGQGVAGLARVFWPGPLSVLVPARKRLSTLLRDADNQVSVRLTSHPLARELCLRSGVPLVATSANLSGRPPAEKPFELDPEVVKAVQVVVDQRPWPGGGPPSTVVQVVGPGIVRILRQGAVSASDIQRAGFEVQAAP